MEKMGFRLILHRYIVSEILPLFFISLIIFIFAMASTRMFSISRWVLEHNGGLRDFIKMFIYIQPSVIFLAMPASLLLSTLICFLRLSGDNELVAVQSSGISIFQLLYPVLIISSIVMISAFFMAFWVVPKANGSFKDTIFEIIKRRPHMGIKEHVFSSPFKGITFYVGHISSKKQILEDVFIVDRRDPETQNTVFAKRGRILADPDKRNIMIVLEDGTVSSVSKDFRTTRNIRFGTYRINVTLEEAVEGISSRKKTINEMSLKELRYFILNSKRRNVKYYEAMLEYYEKFSIPIAIFFMGIIGVPLGAQLKYGGRSIGVVAGLMVFLIYYISITGVRSIGETGRIDPSIGVWIPVLLLAGGSIYLIIQTSKGHRLKVFEKALWFVEKRKKESDIQLSYYEEEKLYFYIGNVRMNRFHVPHCRWARRISPENRIIFSTREDALKSQYEPCKVCHP